MQTAHDPAAAAAAVVRSSYSEDDDDVDDVDEEEDNDEGEKSSTTSSGDDDERHHLLPPHSASSSSLLLSPHASSMDVFVEFLRTVPSSNSGEGTVVDASQIVSKACFDRWLQARKIPPTRPEKSFQRTLSAHITGLDGRSPFEPQQEAAILEVLRKPQRWPCFEHESVKFGLRGFRAKGYHEKKQVEARAAQAAAAADASAGAKPSSARSSKRASLPLPVPPPPTPHQHQQQVLLSPHSSASSLLSVASASNLLRTASFTGQPQQQIAYQHRPQPLQLQQPLFPPVSGGGGLSNAQLASPPPTTSFLLPLDSPRFPLFSSHFAAPPPQHFIQQQLLQQQQQRSQLIDPLRLVLPMAQPATASAPPPSAVVPPPPQLFPHVLMGGGPASSSTTSPSSSTLPPFSPTTMSMLDTQKRLRSCNMSESSTTSTTAYHSSEQPDVEARFLESARDMLSSQGGSNSSAVWREIDNLGRMYLLARGWSMGPTQASANSAVAAYEQTTPGCLVMILDLLDSDPRNRVLAVSNGARMFLGPITRAEQQQQAAASTTTTTNPLGLFGAGGDDHAWRCFAHVVDAFRHADRESAQGVDVELSTKMFSGRFTVYAKVFSSERLVGLRAVPLL